ARNSISQAWTEKLAKCIPSRSGSGSSKSWRGSPPSILRRKSSWTGELLGSTGGNGWPGPAADAAVVARLGADQGRSGCDRESHAPADPQPGAVPQGDRGAIV